MAAAKNVGLAFGVVMSNITTKVLIAAIIVLQIAAYSACLAIQELQANVRLYSQKVTALERELRASNGYVGVPYRALAEAHGNIK
jgi:hypothetical protein